MRIRPWHLALLMLLLCGGVFALLEWRRSHRDFSDAALLMRLPDADGSCLYLDVRALRRSGLLEAIAGPPTEEEPEYKAFVAASGFDYRVHLDTIMAYFGPDFDLFIVRGQLSWGQISRYMKDNAAQCTNAVCSLGLSGGRFLSAIPLSENVVAFGVGGFRTVVFSTLDLRARKDPNLPSEPLWLEFSEAFLKNPKRLPEGTRAFLTAVAGAKKVFFAVSPDGEMMQGLLTATFATPEEAAAHRAKLEENTNLLRTFFERDHQQPDSSTVAKALLAGSFEQKGVQVIGRWPLSKALFLNVVAAH